MSDLEDDWETLIASERRDRILGVLRMHKGVHLEGAIPERKLANARATMKLPPGERVLAMIDCTVFGSAKNGLVFGERALYYHNSWTVSEAQHRGAASVDYARLARLPLTKSFMEVRFPGGSIEVAGSEFSGKTMLALLQQLQHAILHGTARDRATGGTYIAAHRVTRACLEPTNEVWPNGIAANADASVLVAPLTEVWAIEHDAPCVFPPVIVRDFVVALSVDQTAGNRSELVGFELTTGRRFWRRALHDMPTDRLVADVDRVYVRIAAEWFAFDLESGEPSTIEVAALDPRLRTQLVLATAVTWRDLDDFAVFGTELADPDETLHLLAANHRLRVYAPFAFDGFSPAITIVSPAGRFAVANDGPTDYWTDVVGHALTDRYVLLGQRSGCLRVIDTAVSPPAIVDEHRLPHGMAVEISVGSDHVVVASGSRIRCYRGAR